MTEAAVVSRVTAPVAVVTGAGSGIGRAVSRALLGAGYRVALAGRRVETLRETGGDGPGVLVVPTDVSDASAVAALFARVRERWGRVDVLFNNAGSFGPRGSVDEVSTEDWAATVGVNLTGSFLCAREAFATMRDQEPRGGRIINNGSISAHSPRPRSVAYTTTKHAITGLTRSISLDGRPYDIACGQIDIGNAATELTSAIPEPTFDVARVADAVLFMAGLPLDTNVLFLTITATAMPFIGRG
jgi:NAD(P)-dependent dehydrogenase (short-subunit alcohol dehydrogenase family)